MKDKLKARIAELEEEVWTTREALSKKSDDNVTPTKSEVRALQREMITVLVLFTLLTKHFAKLSFLRVACVHYLWLQNYNDDIRHRDFLIAL